MLNRLHAVFSRFLSSVYLKIFASFLATCVLFFIALALFWNNIFNDMFYKDKRELLQARAGDVELALKQMQEGSIFSRELRFALRFIARGINGEIWIAGEGGTILYGSEPDVEGKLIPKRFDDNFAKALRSKSDYFIGHLRDAGPSMDESYLTYFVRVKQNNQSYTIFLHARVEDIRDAVTVVRYYIWVPLLFSLVAVGLILFILSRRLSRPLRHMNEAALALASGDFSAKVPVSGNDEIGQLAHSFNFMIDQLQHWEDTRQDFLTNVSHELRSPLTTLRGMIAALNDKIIPEPRIPHYLQICDREVQRLQRLVGDLLDLARIQNGAGAFHTSRIDAVRTAQDVIDLLAPAIAEKGLKLHVWVPDESTPPAHVQLDSDRYAQVLNNLLYNAMQFSPADGSITVWMGVSNGKFTVRVRDTGIGMSAEEQKRIWERFYKADPSRGARTEGTGLGLTIVKHLVEAMGGSIEVYSEPGNGSEFTVRFPLLRGNAAAEE
ncbi:sensor histidine kinase [Paenibacillus cymbidii]|uniref:sensor histidine kinase n=1 Tax=Paenibacillus cymbidii TaxID=1639034 RepID=UPI001F440BD6|nr:HAMP domain-containing sensor histidine kinase [Paenibacillus cymbidii]